MTVLESVSTLLGYYQLTPINCPRNGCPVPQLSWLFSDAILGLALVLLVVGLLGVWGAQLAYLLGAFLSAALFLLLVYTVLVAGGSYLSEVGAVVAAAATVANFAATRARSRLAEQANPMNLPVFG
jgi:NADH:ubiquinone oxidoreductase subunit K